jgi:NAD(P)-dependent dehydrogenase (short-subunit alcohol dehydrogenase family)
MTLAGKVALVTGGGSGLGKASALKLAQEGADVAVLSRTGDEVQSVADTITGMGRKALALEADVSSDSEMKAAFEKLSEAFGRLDIVFANAGINGVWAPIDDLSPQEWDQTMAVNLRGTFLTVHYAIPLMRDNGGSIIITSSINGTRTFTTPGASAYSTTKAGQVAFAQMAALELARYKIRVNAICPGAIESSNTDRAGYPAEYPDGDVPLTKGEPGKASDVAELVAFLASDNARHITGTPVWIDGAQSLLV